MVTALRILLINILFFFFLTPDKLHAQLLEDHSQLVQSTWEYSCFGVNTPRIINVKGFALVPSFSVDSIFVNVVWGDGLDTQIVIPTSYYSDTVGVYDIDLSHSYDTVGTYHIEVLANNLTSTGSDHTDLYGTVTGNTNCHTISGQVFNDFNVNCELDNGESLLSYKSITITHANGDLFNIAFSDSIGNYSMALPIGENLRIYLNNNNSPDPCTPVGGYALPDSGDTVINLGKISPDNYDVKVMHGGTQAGAAGSTGLAGIRLFAMTTSIPHDVQIEMDVDSLLTLGGSVLGPAPDSIVGQTAYWNYHVPANTGFQKLMMPRIQTSTPIGTPLDTEVFFSAKIIDHANDNNPNNNFSQWSVDVGGPFDPNNKLVDPQGVGDEGWVPQQTKFTYTVNFQNTGTAPAIDVVVRDTFSDNLDLSTIEIIDASHPMEVHMKSAKFASFEFNNIYLPDSSADYEASMGYFTYTVSARDDLPTRTEIYNTAHIYFDYNEPIITNTTINTIDTFPHPELTGTIRHITCLENDNGKIDLVLKGGAPPIEILWSDGSTELSRNQLSPGHYSLTVTDGEGSQAFFEVELEDNRQFESPVLEEIKGFESVQDFKDYQYEVEGATGSTYQWNIVGGELVEQVANQAIVRWYGGPVGTIEVQATSFEGCTSSIAKEVEIQFLGVASELKSALRIYPNPANDFVTISFEHAESRIIELIDLKGRVVLQQNVTNATETIDIQSLPKGVYTTSIIDERGKRIEGQFIKE